MQFDYSDFEKLAREKEDENWKFRSCLEFYDEMSDEQLDVLVFEITDKIWSSIDCTKCGRCCEKLKPMLSDKDQKRLAKTLQMTVEHLRERYLEYENEDDEPDWRTKSSPCPFLQDKKCTVDSVRPDNCREYPYLHKPGFNHRTWGIIERTLTCPIVFCVMEELKKEMDFDPNKPYY